MTHVELDQAKAHLRELIDGLTPGEQLVIVQEGKPVATLTRNAHGKWHCAAGSARDTQHWMSPDFDAPLEDFREYMQ